ncbi:MAG TPA: hypothetical protein VLM36_06380 [Sphingomicrobium sp.]|jgi:hypothetical protein|nr:hypothetical protein [Sphingomicrobium sp.]
MRYLAQALIMIIGLGAAIVAVKAEQVKVIVGNCYEVTAASVPTICE